MKNLSRITFALFFAIATCLPIIGCDRKGPDKLESMTIATFSKALGNTPYHIAKHFNWFGEVPELQGINITHTLFNDRPTISAAFDKGELQVLFSAEAPQYLCRAQGNDIRIVALSASAAQEIIVPTESAVQSVPDLRGKKLAVLAGTSSHYGLLKILKTFNISPAEVNIVYMSPTAAETAFETNAIDAWAVWAPWVEKQEVTGKGRALTGGDAVIHSTMAVPTTLITKHEPVVRAVVSVIQKAKVWMQANPEEAQSIAAKELGLDVEVVKRAWPKLKWGAQLNEDVIADIQEKANFLTEQDKSRQTQALDVKTQFIDLRFLKSGSK